MKKYRITSIRESRKMFWTFCNELGGEYAEEANKKRKSFKLDFNIMFCDWKDGLCKDGVISQGLYERATLYK